MKLKRAALLAVVTCLIVGLFPGAAPAAARQSNRGGNASGTVTRSYWAIVQNEVVEFKGRILPARQVEVSANQAGRVEDLLVRRGERVTAGQPLARMEGLARVEAQIATARLEVLAAEQRRRELDRRWQVERAQAQAELAALNRRATMAQDRLDGLLARPGEERLAQARANLLLASNQLDKAREELRKVEKKFNNRKSPIWYFVNRRTFRLLLAQLEGAAAQAERRYIDASEKLDELLEPPDALDAAVARTEVEAAQAEISGVQRRIDKLKDGPEPDSLEQIQAQLQSAQAALRTAEEEREALTLNAPFDAVVAEVYAGDGEWILAGQPAVLLADTSAWQVEASDVSEEAAAALQADTPVLVRLDAYPDVELPGHISRVDLVSREEDGDVYFPVRVDLQGSDPRLRWGLTARIQTKP